MRDRDVVLPQGTVRVREHGEGQAVVFLHGVLVNGRLWDRVVERLGEDVRVVVPELPLGSHRSAMNAGVDLSPHGVARLVADLLDELDLDDVTLVGNDSGGAIAQLVCARHPERIGRLVLTNCDAFEVFPPAFFKPLLVALRAPMLARLLALSMKPAFLRHGPLGFGRLAKTSYDPQVTVEWGATARTDAGVRRDLAAFARGGNDRILVEAAEELRGFDKPVVLAWGTEDPFFSLDLARRLAAKLPDARIVEIPGSAAFVPVDRPDAVADVIREVVAQPAAA